MRDVTAITITDSNYRLLEYIKFSGTEYITANEKPTNNRYYYLNFELDSIVNDRFIFATNGDSTTDGTFRVTVRTSTTAAQSRYGRNSSTNTNLTTVSTNTFYQCRLRIFNDYTAYFAIANQSGTVLGNYTYSTAQTFTPANMNNFTIMGYNGSNLTAGKVYRYFYRIGDASGELGAHCYPCQRKSDSVCGLYDILSNTFIPMQGTNITDSAAGPTVSEDFPLGVSKIEDSNGDIIWGSQDAFPYRQLECLNMRSTYISLPFKPLSSMYFAQCGFPSSFTTSWGMIYGAEGYSGAEQRFWFAMNASNSGQLFYRFKAIEVGISSQKLAKLNQSSIYECRLKNYFSGTNTSGRYWVALVDVTNGASNQLYGQYYNTASLSMNFNTFNNIGINIANRRNSAGFYSAQAGNADFSLYGFYIKVNDSDPNRVFDAYPVQRKSDGVCGIYDVINSAFYPCSGSASITCAGPVITEYFEPSQLLS